ncbi:MAG: hypothetical protein LBM77_07895 [Spirochaetaceae bacterium]|jgi:hypothetical protein|nr:hypothetical protein [Spirochaetaceae bacterium]
MANSKYEKWKSKTAISIYYLFGLSLLTFILRAVFPQSFGGEASPLGAFDNYWGIVSGALSFLGFFPAISLSAIALPYGIMKNSDMGIKPSAVEFFKKMRSAIILVCILSLLYCLLSLLIQPLLLRQKTEMKSEAELYYTIRGNMEEAIQKEHWTEAYLHFTLCNDIWPESPELKLVKDYIEANAYREDYLETIEENRAKIPKESSETIVETEKHQMQNINLRRPINSDEAISFAEEAMQDERYYDVLYLADFAKKLAGNNAEALRQANTLLANARKKINSLAPTARQEEELKTYTLKQKAYDTELAGKEIEAYYLFKQLLERAPNDPEAQDHFTLTQNATLERAFFIDEVGSSIGRTINDAVFSLPLNRIARIVIYASSLQIPVGRIQDNDSAYITGFEAMFFDSSGELLNQVVSPFAKVRALGNNAQIQLLSLDRNDQATSWAPVWQGKTGVTNANIITLDVSFSDFILCCNISGQAENLPLNYLFKGATMASYGFIPQVFRAELYRRTAIPALFLPMLGFMLVIAWRFRSKNKHGPLAWLMPVLLPIALLALFDVFSAGVATCSAILALTLDLIPALCIISVGAVGLFFLSLVVLSIQKH